VLEAKDITQFSLKAQFLGLLRGKFKNILGGNAIDQKGQAIFIRFRGGALPD